MGLGRNIGNLLVAQIALSVPSILQQRSLDLLSPQNCTKSSWKPVWNVMEGLFETVMIVNAEHMRRVPGRKTDKKDAEWLAELLQVGLLKPSFIPSRPQRELRHLTRLRTSLTQERTRLINRL